jgi:hypothetical protein
MRIVKDGSCGRGELILAGITHELIALVDSGYFVRLASDTIDIIREAQSFEVLTAFIVIAKAFDQLKKIHFVSNGHMTPAKKKEEKRPLDMTSEEAIHYLFPKKVVDKLKAEANPEAAKKKPENNGDCDNDSAYSQS